jgi:GT2 family glycosyltransferase
MNGPPRLSGIVVHWHNEAWLARLVAAWPSDPRFELVVVDNGSREPLPAGAYRRLEPGTNLGFGGGMNAGVQAARGELLLLLNPDAPPEPGALEALLAGFAAHPEAAGLAPRLVGEDGTPQFAWQLRRLPRAWELVAQSLFLAPALGPPVEPAGGTAIEQPAAAALAIRRSAFEAVGGFDPRYHPAWFEDVDLAQRLRARGEPLLYWPSAVFRHGQGASVPVLGYGVFLWLYHRNRDRYLRRHHGGAWAGLALGLLALGFALRLAALPLVKPARAPSRRAAAAGLLGALAGAVSGWRWPAAWRERFQGEGS